MKSLIILIQSVILWIVSVVISLLVGFLSGLVAALFFAAWIASNKDDKTEEDLEVEEAPEQVVS